MDMIWKIEANRSNNRENKALSTKLKCLKNESKLFLENLNKFILIIMDVKYIQKIFIWFQLMKKKRLFEERII